MEKFRMSQVTFGCLRLQVSSCILTKYTDDLSNFFVPDEEVAVYRSKEEAVSKAKYLLK